MLPAAQLRAALEELASSVIACHGPWARAVAFEYLSNPPLGPRSSVPPQPLWPYGPPSYGARYTPLGGAGTIYLANDQVTALQEVEAYTVTGGSRGFNTQTRPWVILAVDGTLSGVLDVG